MKDVLPTLLPKARTDRLVVKELPDETLVYDLNTDKAHCLNLVSTRIWKICDGQRNITELGDELERQYGTAVGEDLIRLGLDQLQQANLLENLAQESFQLPGVGRRELLKRGGVVTLALPLIVSLTASPAQAQASLLAPGRCCGNPTQCASNNCTQTPTCTSPPPPAPSTKACA